jgi:thioredoxin reductase (NADPH)
VPDNTQQIIVYGTTWCGDCRRSVFFLNLHQVPFQWVDIDKNAAGRSYVEKANGGRRVVPTILFPDGSTLAEPSDEALAAKLGIEG